jgi:cellulose synthase/poly-beta-1,6-N-acetylglucosamine synthase-like glycosyltransferase
MSTHSRGLLPPARHAVGKTPARPVLPDSNRRRRIFAVIPAHNESAVIADAIASLRRQTRPPDLIVVVPNNCTDDTADIARECGAYVVPFPGTNPDRKAGAINFALTVLETYLQEPDAVLVMDADTTLSPDFLDIGDAHLRPGVGGVGGTFVGRECRTTLGYLQRMEFYRYGNLIRRHGGRAFVLTGTGTLFSWRALLDVRVARRRGRRLPAGVSFYDTRSLTEDNELTFAVQALGYAALSPQGMYATTDVMERPGTLIAQRERWYLGALRNIWHYGRRMPWQLRWVYWRQQAGLLLATAIALAYLAIMAITVTLTGSIAFSWWWATPALLLLIERVATVWRMGWKARLLAASFIPEQLYTLILTASYLRAFAVFIRGGKGGWRAT